MEETWWSRIQDQPWFRVPRDILFNTRVEIAIGAVAFGVLAGYARYDVLKDRARRIPLAFSDRENISKKLKGEGKELPPLTGFYSMDNDLPMKVFEAHNEAMKIGPDDKLFADGLKARIGLAPRKHALITEYTAALPSTANEALGALGKYTKAQEYFLQAGPYLSGAWSDSHVDSYHIEVYPDQQCTSSNGQTSCTTVMRTRSVYDYTTHTYRYDRGYAERSAQILEDFRRGVGDLYIAERLVAPEVVGDDNKDAIRESHQDFLAKQKKKDFTPAEYLAFSRKWLTGSAFEKYRPAIDGKYGEFDRLVSVWSIAASRGRSTSYRTYSRYDSGPREYQIARETLSGMREISSNITNIVEPIVFARDAAPKLEAKIRQYVDSKNKDETHKLRGEIMDLARQMYKKNIPGGLDVDDPVWWVDIMGCILLGGLAGAGVGFAADRGVDVLRRRREARFPPFRPSAYSG